MFDRCRKWRRQLTLRIDNALPVSQWGALEDHLSRCRNCRRAAEADNALHQALAVHTGMMSRAAEERIERFVVEAMRPAPPVPAPVFSLFPASVRALPLRFLGQIAGGALAAAAVTLLFLLPSMQSAGGASNADGSAPARILQNEPPVPLESLLQTPSPRAALIWRKPEGDRQIRSLRVVPVVREPRAEKPFPGEPDSRIERADSVFLKS